MPSAAVPLAHIPAWKRLGLKLKSAQAIPEAATEASNDLDSTKRKRVEEIHSDTPPKKVKKTSKNKQSNTEDPLTPRLIRKKSVTFTPETKAEDGDSIKQLFNSWVAEQKFQDPSFDFKNSSPAFQTPEPSEVEEVVDGHLDEKERRLKRVKKPKQEKTSSKPGKPSKITKAVTTPPRPFLQYLRQYSESKDTWKFNKNHQNHLIRSIFSVEAIPSDHAHFIYKYVQGLQGGVRTRLRDTALAIKVKDQEELENMPGPEQRKRDYDAAIRDYVETMIVSNSPVELGYEEGVLLGLSDQSMKERVAKRIRSELILHKLGSVPESQIPQKEMVNGDDSNQNKGRANEGKVARRRKQRTAAADEDSSSSEESDSDSDSNSDSDSDSEGSSDGSSSGEEARDDTSSSSSSSSGSDSEEDSEDVSSEESEDSDSD
jgi:hypothetical protein